jgi:serine/threonine protein kinase
VAHESSASQPDSFLQDAANISDPSSSTADAFLSDARRSAFASGTVVAKRYRLEQELDRGGQGVVWEAIHVVTRRRVALKFVRARSNAQSSARRRFLREARAATAAKHPNVVEVLELFELEDGTPVMVMELLSGETLRDKLVRRPKLSTEEVATIFAPVIAAVVSAHARGIVHRDLKPENIFLASGADEPLTVKVLDFGVAKLLEDDGQSAGATLVTGTGAMLGTPSYMAPEVGMADTAIDARADIWALGVMLYECLAGKRPLEAPSIGGILVKLVTDGIRPLEQCTSGVPPAIAGLVMRMLVTKREERLEDLREVRNALLPFVDPSWISDRVPGAPSTAGVAGSEEPGGIVAAERYWTTTTTRTARRRLYVAAAVAIPSLLLLSAYRAPRPASPQGATTSSPVAEAQRPSRRAAAPAPSPPTSTDSEGSAKGSTEHSASAIDERAPSDPPVAARSVVAVRAKHRQLPSEAPSRSDAHSTTSEPSIAPRPTPEPFRGDVVKTPPF